MSRLVKSQWHYFRLCISKASDFQRRLWLDSITKEQLKALVQIVVNFLQRVLTVQPFNSNDVWEKQTLSTTAGRSIDFTQRQKGVATRKANPMTQFIRAVEPSLRLYLKWVRCRSRCWCHSKSTNGWSELRPRQKDKRAKKKQLRKVSSNINLTSLLKIWLRKSSVRCHRAFPQGQKGLG